jgi:hypothetical protein
MQGSTHRKTWPRRWRAGFLVATAVGAMAVLAAGLRLPLVARLSPNAESEPSAVASIVDGDRPTTIIVATPNSNDCRRYQLNVTTGVRNDQRSTNCAGDADKGPTRLEAISKSFRSR